MRYFRPVHNMTSTRRWAVALLFILAFLLQATLLQTHRHAPPTSQRTSISARTTPCVTPSQPVADCPICDTLAQSGCFLTPTPFTLVESVLPTLRLPSALLVAPAFEGRSHDWQSRAPPENA